MICSFYSCISTSNLAHIYFPYLHLPAACHRFPHRYLSWARSSKARGAAPPTSLFQSKQTSMELASTDPGGISSSSAWVAGPPPISNRRESTYTEAIVDASKFYLGNYHTGYFLYRTTDFLSFFLALQLLVQRFRRAKWTNWLNLFLNPLKTWNINHSEHKTPFLPVLPMPVTQRSRFKLLLRNYY